MYGLPPGEACADRAGMAGSVPVLPAEHWDCHGGGVDSGALSIVSRLPSRLGCGEAAAMTHP